MTEITYIDHAGEETLRRLGQLGANFTAATRTHATFLNCCTSPSRNRTIYPAGLTLHAEVNSMNKPFWRVKEDSRVLCDIGRPLLHGPSGSVLLQLAKHFARCHRG